MQTCYYYGRAASFVAYYVSCVLLLRENRWSVDMHFKQGLMKFTYKQISMHIRDNSLKKWSSLEEFRDIHV